MEVTLSFPLWFALYTALFMLHIDNLLLSVVLVTLTTAQVWNSMNSKFNSSKTQALSLFPRLQKLHDTQGNDT